jgi:uncharacterized spore protein YtfJ
MPATVPGAMIAKIAERAMADVLFMAQPGARNRCEIQLTLRICGAAQKNLRPRATGDAVTASSRDACLPSDVPRTFAKESLMSSLTLLQSLHENLAGRAQVKSVFGDPVTAGEKTIIPVAKIAYGFGAGAGTGGMGDTKPKGEGGGGGGGVRAIPVGVFEVSARETRFVAIHDRKKTLGTLLAGAALGLLFARRKRIR